ncbi:Aspartyl protease family protein [Babesia bovis T2Bo]|uniref:Aspartyl protease family protein n=1 Tax=Babesia bovis T2Bo TaxID=484906 RepID=UPI001C34D8A6|nr:Aspartyl protease family protein [Babesia bovis T2Bo]EDO08575.2 Aspartyl protease family protein [Babesia bovis T2Bo]
MLSINVVAQDDRLVTLFLEEDWTLAKLRTLVEQHFNIPADSQYLLLYGSPLNNDVLTVKELGIKTNDVIYVIYVPRAANNAYSSAPIKQNDIPSDFETSLQNKARHFLKFYLPNPLKMDALKYEFPDVYEAVRTGEIEQVVEALRKIHLEELEKKKKRQADLIRAYNNPLTPESQQIIQESIQQERIEENLISAQEHLPESFYKCSMLFIPVQINGVNLEALVDTGAQNSVMRIDYAEKCNLLNIIDRRFQGVAVGISKERIIGKIHMAQMKIGNLFLLFSSSVIEQLNVGFIIGLDIMRQYQCVVSLKENILYLGEEKVPFMAEKDVVNGTSFFSDAEADTEVEPVNPGKANSIKAITTTEGGSTSIVHKHEDQPSDESVNKVIELLSVSREKAIALLQSTDGNVDMAVRLYLDEHYD